MTPSTESSRDFCAGIGPLQLGVVLVLVIFESMIRGHMKWDSESHVFQ